MRHLRACLLASLATLSLSVLAWTQVPATRPAAPAQTEPTGLPPIALWPDGATDALGKDPVKDIPTITPFLPEKPNGTAIIVCPGGGYVNLSGPEGRNYALFLNQYNITAFVLKYRLGPTYHHPSMLNDAARALRMVRADAAKYQIDPARIGIMGSSAGGHLASTLMTHFDAGKPDAADPIERVSSRPDFGILCYAVITMGPDTHKGSHDALLGQNPSEDLVKLLSNELQVTDQTPPAFVWATFQDNVVKIENSLNFVAALRAHKVPFDFHIYQNGGHGLGLGDRVYPYSNRHPWTNDLLFWLKARKLLP